MEDDDEDEHDYVFDCAGEDEDDDEPGKVDQMCVCE